ncbi:phage tail tape measure protein [Streptomyces mangrovi]|uniref:phage tail tape measure protein n=1 Tax=Streptomyces mangrovi TaxID=1206892 RepID=UPI00399CCBA2
MPSVGYATLQIIPSVKGIGDDIRRQLAGPAEAAGEQAGDAAGGGFKDRMNAAAAAAGVAAGAVLVKGLTDAIGQMNAASTLQAQLGTTDKVAAQHGKLAGKLYGSGVSGSFQEAADSIKHVVQSGLAPPDATNKQLQQIATRASDVAGVFGQDLGGVTNSVSQMMRTGLAKDSKEAFDIITAGFQQGADKGGDLLDTMNEYGTQFRKAGLDGSTAMGLISQAIKAGARDSDVAADAIKEFSLRAVDGSSTTADGFKMLGLNADDMAKKFAKGGSSANGVLDLTLDKLRNIKDPVERSQAAVALFGTQAEDLGDALFAMDPSGASKELGKFGGAADKLGKTVRSGPGHELTTFTRDLQSGLVNVLGTHVIPILREVLGAIRPFAPVLLPLAGVITGIVLGVKAWTVAQAAWNLVMAANPAVLIIVAVVALAAALVLAYKKSETFRNIVDKALSAVRTAAMWLWEKALKPFFDWFGKIVSWLWTSIIKPYIGFIVAYWKMVGRIAMWLWESVISPVFKAIGAIISWWWTNIVKRYFNMVKFAVQSVGAVFKWLYDKGVKPVMKWIGDRISWVWENVIKKAFDALKRAVGKVKDAFEVAKDGIGKAWDKIKDAAKKPINWVIRVVWNDGIVGTWGKIRDWIPGLPKLEKLPLLAAGGPMPVQPGVFNRPTAIVGEGNPRHPEYVIPTDPKYRRRALALHAAAGSQLLADGGIIGKIRSAVGSAADFLTDPVKGLKKLLEPITSKLKSLTSSSWGKMAAGLPRAAIGGLTKMVKGFFTGDGGASVDVGGAGVKRWTNVVLQALRLVGQPGSLLGTTLRRMNQESGGNPRAVNLWDINAKNGTPSVGLMQVIGPTFRAHAGRFRGRGPFMYGVSIDPLANIYASMRYALSRYGSLSRAYNRPGGYDSGGWLMPGATLAVNATGRPEAVLTAPQWRVMEEAATRGAGLQPGDRLALRVADREFDAYVESLADGRMDAGFTRLRRTLNAGRRG